MNKLKIKGENARLASIALFLVLLLVLGLIIIFTLGMGDDGVPSAPGPMEPIPGETSSSPTAA